MIPFTFSPLLAVREDFGESLDVETREGLTVSLEEDVVPFEYACTLEEEVLFSCPSGVLWDVDVCVPCEDPFGSGPSPGGSEEKKLFEN